MREEFDFYATPSESLKGTSQKETQMTSLQSPASSLAFEVQAREGEARAGIITTRRGEIETPVFMPVGTAGTVKGIRFEELELPTSTPG